MTNPATASRETKYATNLKCQSCVSKIAPSFDEHTSIDDWSVDTTAIQKWLTVSGEVSKAEVQALLQQSGFQVVDPPPASSAASQPSKKSWFETYRPLLLIVSYLVGMVLLSEWMLGSFQSSRAMRHFMGGFFLTFSFFKLLNVSNFAQAFSGYDLLAKNVPGYGLAYPFLEVGLGVAYLANLWPIATNIVTAVVMLAGLIGVAQVLSRKQKIQCACLGTVFELPMSVVTLIENGTMLLMALWMLL